MATEGPATCRIQVAEHPRWGRGDTAVWDLLDWQSADGVQGFRLFTRAAFAPGDGQNPRNFIRPCGWACKKAHRTFHLGYYQGCVFCFSHADPSFPFLAEGGTLFCRALAKMPKLTLNRSSLCLACQLRVVFKVPFLKYSLKTIKHSKRNKKTLGLCILLNKWNLSIVTVGINLPPVPNSRITKSLVIPNGGAFHLRMYCRHFVGILRSDTGLNLLL